MNCPDCHRDIAFGSIESHRPYCQSVAKISNSHFSNNQISGQRFSGLDFPVSKNPVTISGDPIRFGSILVMMFLLPVLVLIGIALAMVVICLAIIYYQATFIVFGVLVVAYMMHEIITYVDENEGM